MTIKRRQHRYVSSVKLGNAKQSSFNLLIFLNHVLSGSGIYQLQNIWKTFTVLAKTPLLTLKLMMC